MDGSQISQPWLRNAGTFTGRLGFDPHNAGASYVEIGEGSQVTADLEVRGANSRIVIGRNCILGGFFSVKADGGEIVIGDGTMCAGLALHVEEPGAIRIGQGCMLGRDTFVCNSDIHPIFDDETGERINPARDVTIGDRAWIGIHAFLLKGATVEDGAIVGAGAVLSGLAPARCIVAGNPARVVRRGVSWSSDL